MRSWKAGFATAALLLTALSPIQAQPATAIQSASDLNVACMSAGSATCMAYIAGFSHGFYYASVSVQAGYPPCLPSNLPDGQARAIVMGFMQAHAEMMQQAAPSVIAEALITAFPCGHKAGPTIR